MRRLVLAALMVAVAAPLQPLTAPIAVGRASIEVGPEGDAAARETAPREAEAPPRVVIVVGPSGAATDRYRDEGRAAAKVARRFTPDVIEVFSPDATWPAVRSALKGASLVVYMGHGNGWPSRYRDRLDRASQNGFGVNPVPGGADDRHQYVGEGRIAEEVRLAEDAVVLLHHLCYASGLSEPGLPEGTPDQARQRVDNYAAGFIAAGAAAVMAEAYASPSRAVAAILTGARSIDAIWRSAPTANGQAFAFDSVRSPGYLVQMDPSGPRAGSGFERSLVLRRGLAASDVLADARAGQPRPTFVPDPFLPSLIQTGISLGAPTLQGTLRTGGANRIRIPFTIDEPRRLPEDLLLSAAWVPMDPPPAVPSVPEPYASIAPLAPADMLEPVAVRIGARNLVATLDLPEIPGRYRLDLMLHDDTGLAFDAASQAMLPMLAVRVAGEVDGELVAPAELAMLAGRPGALDVQVVNLGAVAWGQEPIPPLRGRGTGTAGSSAVLTGRWIAAGGEEPGPSPIRVPLPAGLPPAASVALTLPLAVPKPGEYLLVLDVEVPEHGSLVALGGRPTFVRVHVEGPPSGSTLEVDPAAASRT